MVQDGFIDDKILESSTQNEAFKKVPLNVNDSYYTSDHCFNVFNDFESPWKDNLLPFEIDFLQFSK